MLSLSAELCDKVESAVASTQRGLQTEVERGKEDIQSEVVNETEMMKVSQGIYTFLDSFHIEISA